MKARTRSAQILTPEDVTLDLQLASWDARLVAFLLDVTFMCTIVALPVMILDWASPTAVDSFFGESSESQQLYKTVRNFLVFAITKFYFIFFEIKFSGQTPGKQLLGLRVTTQDGSALGTGSIVARNLTRDLETIFPLMALIAPSTLGLEGGLQIVLFLIWLVALSCIPFMNRHGYRLGDLIAKTMVIRLPPVKLLADLADPTLTKENDNAGEGGTGAADLRFTREQLSHYGAEELHVLEGVLRFQDDDASPGAALVVNVAGRIAAKTGWTAANEALAKELADHNFAQAFLKAFYRA